MSALTRCLNCVRKVEQWRFVCPQIGKYKNENQGKAGSYEPCIAYAGAKISLCTCKFVASSVVFTLFSLVFPSNLWGRAVGGRIVLNDGSSGYFISIHESRIRNAVTSLVVSVVGKYGHSCKLAKKRSKRFRVIPTWSLLILGLSSLCSMYYKCHCGLQWGLSSASWSSWTWF